MSKIFVADKLKIQGTKTLFTIALILLLTISAIIATLPAVKAQSPRQTLSYVSVFPTTIGIGQTLLINAWVAPNPENNTNPAVYHNLSLVFTKPDGTTLTVIPNQEPGLPPGVTEASGTIFYNFVPTTLGTWSVVLVFPGENFGGTFNFAPSTSPPATFTVQQQPVIIGTQAPPLPGSNNNWTTPINAENYNWATLGGAWLQPDYNGTNSAFNPYTTAPTTAHILWTQQTTLGGLAGGDWGSYTLAGTGVAPPVVMFGRVYFNEPDGIHCVNLYTGQTLWITAGARFTVAQLGRTTALQTGTTISIEAQTGGVSAYLWDLNTPAYHRYDALTGVLQLTIPNATYAPQLFGGIAWDPYLGVAYIYSHVPTAVTGPHGTIVPPNGITSNGNPGGWLIMWNSSAPGVTTNWANGIQWNVTVPTYAGPSPVYTGDVVVMMNYNQRMVAYDAATGKMLWDTGPLGYQIYTSKVAGDGNAYVITDFNRTWHAFNIYTGQVTWSSPQADYPWGTFWSYTPVVAYGNVYGVSYDGNIYAFNDKTGQIAWKFFSGNTTQSPYNVFPFYLGPVVAGGEVFAGTGEHTPTQPLWSGARLYAVNAYNGSLVWSIAGMMTPNAVADGYLFAVNAYDGLTYCFGKGNTATTVSATPTVVGKGSSILIQGTVTDRSPGAAGTPAISDQDMSAWMEYLYMQKQIPGHATGVSVTLTAIDPNGNTQNIGTVTCDVSGLFKAMWTPPVPGAYTIIASFGGSNSYFPSYAETAIGVSSSASPLTSPSSPSAPSASPPVTSSPSATVLPSVAPTPTSPPNNAGSSMTLYIVAAAALVIIVVVAAIAVVLRKRK